MDMFAGCHGLLSCFQQAYAVVSECVPASILTSCCMQAPCRGRWLCPARAINICAGCLKANSELMLRTPDIFAGCDGLSQGFQQACATICIYNTNAGPLGSLHAGAMQRMTALPCAPWTSSQAVVGCLRASSRLALPSASGPLSMNTLLPKLSS